MAAKFRRGDSFHLSGAVDVFDPIAGAALSDFTGWAAGARMIFADGSFEALDATLSPAGVLDLSAADTSAWPVGSAYYFVRYTAPDGFTISSDNIELMIIGGGD